MRRSGRLCIASLAVAALTSVWAALPAAAEPTSGPSALSQESVADARSTGVTRVGTSSPTASPTPSPKPSPSGEDKQRVEEKKKAEAELDFHDAAALVEASEALTEAEEELERAKLSLETARGELESARRADAQAQIELEAAVLSHQRAVRELVANRKRLEERRADLGQLARAAYQSNGPLGELALVLESQTPKQMTDRIAFVQSIASAGNAVVADLEDARADLENAKARLAAAREVQQERRTLAAEALAAIEAKERVAALAEQHVTMVVTLRKLALDAALEAKKVDQQRYQVMRVQSGRLGTRIAELSAALDKTKRPPKGTGSFVRPGTGATTSPFGPRLHPILNYVKVHTGLDMGVGDGFAYAADDGVVIITEANVAYGNMTVIYHGKRAGIGTATLYAHQAAFGVKPGDRVRKGQAIGVIGSTGYSTGPHLHFEVMLDGQQVDPDPFLEDAPLPPGARR